MRQRQPINHESHNFHNFSHETRNDIKIFNKFMTIRRRERERAGTTGRYPTYILHIQLPCNALLSLCRHPFIDTEQVRGMAHVKAAWNSEVASYLQFGDRNSFDKSHTHAQGRVKEMPLWVEVIRQSIECRGRARGKGGGGEWVPARARCRSL